MTPASALRPLLCLSLAVATDALMASDWFVESSEALGIDFVHDNGQNGRYHFVETAASGGGWLDFDRDGDPDLYLINAGSWPVSDLQHSIPAGNRLYENRDGHFVDITEQSGTGDSGYGMGLCVGDVDADGRLDFMLTNAGPDRLYRNLGKGRFAEISEQSGVAGNHWSTGCAFADLDADGDLDLYVVHYVDYPSESTEPCSTGPGGRTGYCHPTAYRGQPDALYINQGDGRFIESGALRGIEQGRDERGFGLVISDLNDDGHPDIYVANDGTRNRLYVNDGNAHFSDDGMMSGSALNMSGLAEAGMGVDLGDVDGDGREDLIVTHFAMESNTLYRALGQGQYEDATNAFGLAKASWLDVGWGVKLFDLDNDADLDLAIANGHVQDHIDQIEPRLSHAQPNQLFVNEAHTRFTLANDRAGPAWRQPRVSRGLAVADLNSDGRLDVLITHSNARPDLLINQYPDAGQWLGVDLVGPSGNSFALGARLELQHGTRRQIRQVRSGDSFLSQSTLRQHFGLGSHAGLVTLTIHWPDGLIEHRTSDALGRYWRVSHPDADDAG